MIFAKVFGIALVGLTIIYLSMSAFLQSVRRDRLERQYDAAPVAGVHRDAHVAMGMTAYRPRLRRQLVVLVYLVPVAAVGIIVYVVNSN